MFCRVVMWPKPREYRSATSASACSCALGEHALRDLHAQHLRVVGLALAVGAAHEPEGAPLVGADLAALELRQRVGELVDVGPRCANDSRVRGPGSWCRPSLTWSLPSLSVAARRATGAATCGAVSMTPPMTRASATTSPMTIVPGQPGRRCRRAPSVAKRADPGVRAAPARGRHDRGRRARRQPRAISRPAIAPRVARPISTTSVAAPRREAVDDRAVRALGVARDDDERRVRGRDA